MDEGEKEKGVCSFWVGYIIWVYGVFYSLGPWGGVYIV